MNFKLNQRMESIIKSDTGKFLRLRIDMGKGCGGFQYDFSMDNKKPKDTDFALVFENKVAFALDDLSLLLVKGCTIDFIDSGVS